MDRTEKILKVINLISPANRSKCLQLFEDYRIRFQKSQGSKSKHQVWEGGYIDHIYESMEFGIGLYELITKTKKLLPFELSDVAIVLFLHDLEKPFKYVAPKKVFKTDESKKKFIDKLMKKYGIALSDNQKNGLKYIHGEGDDYSPDVRVQLELSAFCHICDVYSARIAYQ